MSKPLIGFIGQGYIGKNYADDFVSRKYKVVRYSLEPDHISNKNKIKDCDIVFVAVPTPTMPKGFDGSIVQTSMFLVGKGKIAVIKSTMPPGMTEKIQKKNPNIFVLHSPEFLTEKTAAYDAANPPMNIVGIPKETNLYKSKAKIVLGILPRAKLNTICTVREAELIKYAHNTLCYSKALFVNVLYDFASSLGADWQVIKEAFMADPMVATPLNYHLDPIHKGGRGVGGHCHIKDFAHFVEMYSKNVAKDSKGLKLLRTMEEKNIDLLVSSKKDLDLVYGVYGKIKAK